MIIKKYWHLLKFNYLLINKDINYYFFKKYIRNFFFKSYNVFFFKKNVFMYNFFFFKKFFLEEKANKYMFSHKQQIDFIKKKRLIRRQTIFYFYLMSLQKKNHLKRLK